MSQLAYEQSFHPGPFHAPTPPAHHPQGYPQAQQPQASQAFSHPGQQRRYYDGAGRSDFQQVPQPQPASDGMMQMQQQSFASPPTSNPYSFSVPAQAPFAAPQNASVRQSSNPPQVFSPDAANRSQQTPPAKYPMAAPQTPALQQQQSTISAVNNANAAVASPKTPQSPGAQSREQQRVALLLNINVELLAEVNRLQQLGQGGAINTQQAQQLKNAGQSDKMASDEYIQCLRRVQANLAYLMPKAQSGQHSETKVPPGPAHMTSPAHMPQLKEKYDQLKELFPDWQGLDQRLSQSAAGSSASPRPNTQNGNPNGGNIPNAQVNVAAF